MLESLEQMGLTEAQQSRDFNTVIKDFHKAKAEIPKELTKQQNILMQKVTQDILRHLKDLDPSVCHFYHAGSAFDGLQVANTRNKDFDVPVALNAKHDLVVDKVTPGYVRMRPKDPNDVRFAKYLDKNGYIVPDKIMTTKMFSSIHKAVNKVNQIYRKQDITVYLPIRHGPAIQLNVQKGTREGETVNISVDLVPSFKMSDHERYVAKPYKDYADKEHTLPQGVDADTLWRESFSVEEKEKVKSIISGKGCHKEVLCALKALRNEDPPLQSLTSYHLKTAWLHQTDEIPRSEWTEDKLTERFKGLLERIAKSLEPGGTLPNYYIPDLDLYDGMSDVNKENIKGRIDGLLAKESKMKKALNAEPKP